MTGPNEADQSDQSDLDSTEIYSEDETVIYSDDNSLRILSINVGGLHTKKENPDFENFISSYDIICIQETHFDIYDSISINGYKLLPTMVRCNVGSKSGGIAVLVRDSIFDTIDQDSIFDTIKVVQNSGENFYWFSCSICSNVLFCVTYIPPEGSIYSDINMFDNLESDILKLSQSKNTQICLLGDINAQTGNQSDLVTYDENIEQFLHSDDPNDELAKISIGDLGFPTERHNSDTQSNNYGKRLLEVCKSFNLCIANGRLGSDKFLGNKTCKGSSVVDYAIMSPLLFTSVKEFEILPFEPLVNDAHCGIHISLECSAIESCQNFDNEDILITKATWKTELSNTFLSNLNEDDVECFVEKLALVSTNIITQPTICRVIKHF